MMKRFTLLLALAGLLVCMEIGCGDNTPKVQGNSAASTLNLRQMTPGGGGGSPAPKPQ